MKICIGNMFESGAQTLVNTVNCVGIMGKGIAQEFKSRYPSMFNEYVKLCSEHAVEPGIPYYYSDLTGASVINFPTKNHWRSSSKLSYIISGLKWFRDNYKELGITSIAFPPLGCGNGGLDWETVGPIMYNMLADLPIAISIYAPYGTNPDKLTVEYLVKMFDGQVSDKLGRSAKPINKYWLLILYVIQALNHGTYNLHVGRVIRQKICYVLTREGINTGFVFEKGTYGPYSRNIDEAVTALSNANLLQECQAGDKMVESIVSDSFFLNKTMFTHEEMVRVARTLDLFQRIKNTDQAEVMTTIMFAYDHVSAMSVSEEDVLNYILDWKPRWKDGRESEIKETMYSLELLGMINPRVSFDHEEFLLGL